jgi:hypothetical protein
MCKNNLGCAGKQNCGCGCPSCIKKNDRKTTVDKPILIQTASFEPSGYGKKQKLVTPLPSSSGYSKKNIIPESSKKITPVVEMNPNKEDDNIGLIVSSVYLGLIMLAKRFFTSH